jgi:hypothetical protein
MMVVDLMHEVELGVWKAIFIHLLRILDCYDESLKHELDRRYVFGDPWQATAFTTLVRSL